MKIARPCFLSVIAMSLLLVACSLAQITQLINVAVQILDQAAAVTGVIPPSVAAYFTAASQCIAFAATEQASSDSKLVKDDKIFAECSKDASVVLPPGTAQNVATIASNLAKSIQDILANVAISKTARGATGPDVMSSNDRAALAGLSAKAQAFHLKK